MNDFHFRLEKLLELRAEAEATAAGALAAAQSEVQEAKRVCDSLEAAHAAARAELSELERQGSDAGQLQTARLLLEGLDQGLDEAFEILEEGHELLAERRDEYHRAHRERRALAELKLKRQDAWSRDRARRDQRAMDEVATARHLHRRMVGGEA